jgi:hypothetical protein
MIFNNLPTNHFRTQLRTPGNSAVSNLFTSNYLPGGGKRGGARMIYFFHNETLPVLLLTLYGKNEKVNLSKAERNAMAKLVPALIHGYSKGRGTK